MKFSEMTYTRPDLQAAKAALTQFTADLRAAKDYETARAAFLAEDKLDRRIDTQATLASIRHSIDTRDAFYDAEQTFWNSAAPELQEYLQQWTEALLESPFRKEFVGEFGEIIFTNAEIERKSFSPEIIPEMQKENELTQEYDKLIASAQIPFRDGVYTLSQLSPFKNDADDEIRLAAWKAEGQWYKDHQADLDRIYHELTQLRDQMGKKLGYGGYTQLGYYRMQRNSYTKEDVEAFRKLVVEYLVPVADQVYRDQAKRLGKEYPMSFADNALRFRSGNPKAGGGYCTSILDYDVPFIFANFNGTSADVETVTHEAGHAFAGWYNRKRVPASTIWPTLESCEVHSMSMEFFAWPWAEKFFGPDTRKFLYSHLAGSLTFIPYGTMVDHFQHIVYERPEMTPRERHDVWKELLGVYMPWMRLDGDIPFYADGEGWQRQSHIYQAPFYYIDYCLAQTVALSFWARIQKDLPDAWAHYMAYTEQGGSVTFTELLKNAGLDSPFEPACLKGVCEAAAKWLAEYDLDGIE